MDIGLELDALREKAMASGVPVNRKDGELYNLLGGCLSLCERVALEKKEKELREILVKNPQENKNRRYTEKNSDIYVLVCRYVLESSSNINSVYRWAVALRAASKKQIRGENLPKWLSENGGINTLYKMEKVPNRERLTKTLHLNNHVVVKGNEIITVVLKQDHRGFFDVVEQT